MGEPRTTLPDPRRTPRYAGVPTFCRFPLIELVPASQRPVDWALYGVPFDAGVTYRPGARFGPRAIRIESQYVKPYHLAHDVKITDVLSLADAGDAPVHPFDLEANVSEVASWASAVGDPKHTKLMAVGGDHSIALANIRATHKRRSGGGAKPLALIHFDSHLDTVDQLSGERYTHASPFIRAIEEKLIDPSRMLSIGIKGPLNTRDDLDFARKHGVTLVSYNQWRAEGTKTIDAFLSKLGDAETYLTFDIDCVDPAYAPGTGTPSVGGFTSAEVLSLLRHLAKFNPNLVGADVVEVLPDRDHGGITSLLAAHVMFEILALDAMRRK
ncbi:MAG TPA: agmatinase [Phycisphaerales bacterium]|nr:agmatinase [Phycisphaerales bacterium]